MQHKKNFLHNLTPYQILVSGYLIVAVIGAVLLSCPFSSSVHAFQPFIDSMFVATSGISTSGLTVVDIGSYYNLFGQIVLMVIFQIGGIGYMTIIIFFIYLLGVKIPFLTKNAAVESISGNNHKIFWNFFLYVLAFTVAFELAGAVIIALSVLDEYSAGQAVYFGIFHSISTFCTAGFSTVSTSLMKYADNTVINLTVIIISIAGGLGFLVLIDLMNCFIKKIKNIYPNRLNLHTKIVLVTTLIIMVSGAAVIFISEKWQSSTSILNRVMIAVFQSVSASTTDGFNTIDIGKMSPASLVVLMVQMFIGASPGSTGGGIKTTTIGIIIIFVLAQIRGREARINFYKREIPYATINKAFGIFFWFSIITMIDLIVMNITEKAGFLEIIFEITSALGNTGLSMGITSSLSFTGRLLLIITMFIGRVGPLTFVFSLAGRQNKLPFRYAQENIFVG